MSFAVIQTGGKQYKVKVGEILKIEKFPEGKPNSKIEFKEILAYGDDKNIELGNPVVSGAKVEAELLKNSKYSYTACSGFCAHNPPETNKTSKGIVRFFIYSQFNLFLSCISQNVSA